MPTSTLAKNTIIKTNKRKYCNANHYKTCKLLIQPNVLNKNIKFVINNN